MRTPFSGILSLSEYLYDQETNPTKKELLAEIMKSGQCLLSLLNQVLEISTLGSNALNLSEFSLPEVIQEIADLLQAETRHKKLKINVACPAITLHSDRMRVSRILLNLIGNAVKHTQKGLITVKVYPESPLRVSVKDTGKGIPTDALETIFDCFSKFPPSYKQPYFSGTGVGLHIAREFARALGGDISVQSELGKGSDFTLILRN